jgi:hypothetical protein
VAPGHYGYLSPRRARRYRGAWAYRYLDASGYGYAPWSATVRRGRQWQLPTALSAGRTDTIGLTAPRTSAQGLMYSALPAEGPTLFGPSPPPGYYYGGYYGSAAYGYVSPGGPPVETPSWWLEPRRRR